MLNFPTAYPRNPLPCRSVADNFLTPLAEMRPTRGAGFGAFAIAPIPAGTIVACFGGTFMNRATFDTMPEDRRSRSIQIDDDSFLLGPPEREPGDAINHSCEPNCGMGGAAQVVAMRDIEVGESLTFDYAMADGSDYDEFACACGAPSCRGRVSGTDWQSPELRARYAGYMSPYLVRRVDDAGRARRLAKADVESLMSTYDADPIGALEHALRVVLGRPHAGFETLVGFAPLDSATKANLTRGDIASLDSLAKQLNENRGF